MLLQVAVCFTQPCACKITVKCSAAFIRNGLFCSSIAVTPTLNGRLCYFLVILYNQSHFFTILIAITAFFQKKTKNNVRKSI